MLVLFDKAFTDVERVRINTAGALGNSSYVMLDMFGLPSFDYVLSLALQVRNHNAGLSDLGSLG